MYQGTLRPFRNDKKVFLCLRRVLFITLTILVIFPMLLTNTLCYIPNFVQNYQLFLHDFFALRDTDISVYQAAVSSELVG